FNAAIVVSGLALALRVLGSVRDGIPWTAHAALLPVVAGFCLLMLRPYPGRFWMHAAAALLTATAVALACPRIAGLPASAQVAAWLALGAALAILWLLAGRGLEQVEEPLCERLGIDARCYFAVLTGWSAVFFGTLVMLVALLVTGATVAA